MTGHQYAMHIRANLKAKKPGYAPKIRVIILFATLLAMGAGAIGFQIYGALKRSELTHYDRVQMLRLMDDINR